MNKIILAIDVGTKTGLATFGLDGKLIGSETLVCDKDSQAQNLFNFLRQILSPNMVVAWERPFGKYGQTVLQRMVGAIQCACELVGCDDVPMHLVTVKKFATGDARATKELMMEAAVQKWGGEFDEHQADAAWVGQCAIETVLNQQKAGA